MLFGDVNPSGKLPFTYPRFPNALLTYDRPAYQSAGADFGLKGFQPQFEFGSGLSYTTFAYTDLTISKTASVEISVKVTNTGTRTGKETLLLFVAPHVARITPPGRRLRRFAKVRLEPGESRALRFRLGPDDFSFFDEQGNLVLEPGKFDIAIGGLRQTVTVSR